MERKLKVAIIGQGRSGRDIHGAFLRSEYNKRFEVVAVVDAIAERRTRAKEEWGCDVYADYRELFKRSDLDLVVNASFSDEHGAIAMDLMDHGLNVLSEKPFARSYEEGVQMIRSAKKNKVALMPFQQSRIAPYFEEIRRILDSGVLGEPIQISVSFSGFARRWDWQTSLARSGGNVRNTGPHPLDQVMALLDFPEQVTVFSRLGTVNTFGDAEDYAKILLSVPGKPLVDVEISSCNAYSPYTYVISCKNGCLRATPNLIEYRYFDPAEAPRQKFTPKPLFSDRRTPAYCGEKLPWVEKKVEVPVSVYDNRTVARFYDAVYEHILFGKPLFVTPEQVLPQLKVIDQIHAQNPLKIKH